MLERRGRVWVRGALGERDLALLDRACDLEDAPGARLPVTGDLTEAIGPESPLTHLARTILPGANAVRLIAFNKTPGLNWQVPWHQDRVIAVRDKHDVAGFTAWTKKSDVWHVEPPVELLREMIFARVHLDDTDEQNGCLELALGTHARGRVQADDASKIAMDSQIELCEAQRGDVLFAKALTLHRSRPSRGDVSRRALRVDYSATRLPKPLAWAL
ncbi:MAG: phytanoyl-CoA dioxygenase family protein [Alphaproteobacteria bacterium]|nr:phytanoyl-CoA dioxygenase family protein [Alphaproteobacteria bacterium]